MQAATPQSLMHAAQLQRVAGLPSRQPDAVSVDSHELLRGHKAVEIKHNGAVYRLQTTKLGKLILTK